MYWGNVVFDTAKNRYNIDTPANRAAYAWYQSYAKRYGAQDVLTFKSGVQDFNSPTNAFISGRVSIEVQGPFFSEFIRVNNPSLEWGAAGVPPPDSNPLKAGDVALGDLDVWVIPRGARHRREALDLLRFFSRQDNIEFLAKAHAKPSPRRVVSEDFLATHPNPYIRTFEALAAAKDVHILPQSPVWERARGEIDQMVLRVWKGADVAGELKAVQATCDKYVAEYNRYMAMRRAYEGGK
jgi:multiple sugar transport system substrate-binding protein